MRAAPSLTAFAMIAAILLVANGSAVTDGQTRLATSVAYPVDVAFRADGALLYAELNAGNVRELRSDGTSGPVISHVSASPGGNGGFTGIAPDPTDASVFYLVYSVDKPGATHGKVNRVSKLVGGSETILFDSIPWADFHVGGRIAVGPDGLLYVSTGDNGGPTGEDYTRQPGNYPGDAAQDPQSLIGKILRFTKTGAAAGGVTGWNPYVYAMGFRNPFGLVFGPDGKLYASENGIGHDEVNVIVQGANYGWPECEGDCASYQKPLTTFSNSFGTTGIAYLGGKLYVGDYNGGRLRIVDAATGSASIGWAAGSGSVLDVAAGADGCLYVSTASAIYQVDVPGNSRCHFGATPPPTTTTTTTTTPPSTTTTTTTSTPSTTTTTTTTTTSSTPPTTTTTTSTPPTTTTTTTSSTPPTTTSTTSTPPSTTTSSTPATASTTTPPTASTTSTPTISISPTLPSESVGGSVPTNATQESVSPSPTPSNAPAPGLAALMIAALAAVLVLARKRRSG